ncbi:MAG: hypothetical protein IPG43_22375 [Proteobacteria bacterium]|nr:hypothetical protein [Pseudomonadota bacterium]
MTSLLAWRAPAGMPASLSRPSCTRSPTATTTAAQTGCRSGAAPLAWFGAKRGTASRRFRSSSRFSRGHLAGFGGDFTGACIPGLVDTGDRYGTGWCGSVDGGDGALSCGSELGGAGPARPRERQIVKCRYAEKHFSLLANGGRQHHESHIKEGFFMATRGHLRSGLHTIVLAILASGGVAHAATISIHPEVTAEAVYQGLSAGPISAVHGDPGAASVEAHAGPDEEAGILGTDTQVYDGAIAKARSQLDSSLSTSSVGTYAHAGGYSPGFASPPDEVHAVASVRWVLRFMVNAPSDVTTAQLNAELDVDGTLLAAAYGGSRTPDDLWASVSARATTISSLGTVDWIDASAKLDWTGQLVETGDWAGAFVYHAPPLFHRDQVATVNQHQNLPGLITVPTNEVFEYVVEMTSQAYAVGAYENWAVSDFFNTAAFDLSVATPGLTLARIPTPAVVPLPAAWLLFAGAAIALGARRRRVTP